MTDQLMIEDRARQRVRYAAVRYRKVDRASALWTLQPVKAGARPTLRHILLAVEKETGVHLDEILSPCRIPKIVRARQMYYWLARRLTEQSLPVIGRICAGKDHSTVVHGIHKVNRLRERFEPELSRLLAALTPRTGAGEGSP